MQLNAIHVEYPAHFPDALQTTPHCLRARSTHGNGR